MAPQSVRGRAFGGESRPDPVIGPQGETFSQSRAGKIIIDALEAYGLGSLIPTAADLFAEGYENIDVILLQLEDTPEFKDRFPAIDAIREWNRRNPGLQREVPTPGELIQIEGDVNRDADLAGLPEGFLTNAEIQELLSGGLSYDDISNRIDLAGQAVNELSPEAIAVFGSYFGPNTRGALTAWLLDPDKATPMLENQLEAAQFGASGSRYGFNVRRSTSWQAAQANISRARADQGFSNLAGINPVFTNTVGESAQGQRAITATQGIAAEFGLGSGAGQAQERIRRRVEARQSAFAGGGGVQSSSRGLTGLS